MMYEFLQNSLTSEGAGARMSYENKKYAINGNYDGPCHLKTILIKKFYMETKAMNFHLRQNLQHLPKTTKELKFDISALKDHMIKKLVYKTLPPEVRTPLSTSSKHHTYKSKATPSISTLIGRKRHSTRME
jgi:hypothetical protein